MICVEIIAEILGVLQGGASQPNFDGYSLPASQLPYAIPTEAWSRSGPLPQQTYSLPGVNGAAYQQARSHPQALHCLTLSITQARLSPFPMYSCDVDVKDSATDRVPRRSLPC